MKIRMTGGMLRAALSASLILSVAACADAGKGSGDSAGAAKAEGGDKKAPEAPKADAKAPAKAKLDADTGVDVEKKIIKIGALNDESGPAATIGKPFAVGKRIAAAVANEGGLLPEGWKVEMVERDHGYNPNRSVQLYNELKDDVLFIATSFGTPNTLPLRPMLKRDGMVAIPASLSSKMAEFEFTPPTTTSYELEAQRGLDWIVKSAGGADKVMAGIVYQQDDFGGDALKGWQAAAKNHGVKIVSEQAVAPGQADYTATAAALKKAGATHVLLAVLPSATPKIIGTALKGLQFNPVWLGSTPAWIDAFFKPEVVPGAVWSNYHQLSSLPFWGEEVPGMKAFLAAYEKYGKDKHPADSYILLSYVQGMMAFEAAKMAIEKGDITRKGFVAALHSLKDWNFGGMIQKVDLSKIPYVPSMSSRVLKPNLETKSWTVVADYAPPAGGTAKAASKDGQPKAE